MTALVKSNAEMEKQEIEPTPKAKRYEVHSSDEENESVISVAEVDLETDVKKTKSLTGMSKLLN